MMMKIEEISKSLRSLNSKLTLIQAFERAKQDQYGNIALLFLIKDFNARRLLRDLGSKLNKHKRLGRKIPIGISNPNDKNWMVNLAGFMTDDIFVFVDENVTDEQINILLSVYPDNVQFDN